MASGLKESTALIHSSLSVTSLN